MGMYTGLRFKGIVKKEFRELIQSIHDFYDWEDFAHEFPFLANYAKLGRANFIPRGVLCYMPDEWEEGEFPRQYPTDGFDGCIDNETGYWAFQCSLKNYENEIERFFDEVLPHLLESAEHIEYFYEEWDESKYYELKDGEITEMVNA